MLRGLSTDLRLALRTLRRSRGFAIVAVLTLGLGVGANTAIYSAIRHLLLLPLPVAAPAQLQVVTWRREAEAPDLHMVNSSDYEDPTTGASYASNFSAPLYRALQASAPRGVSLTAFTFLRGATVRVGNRAPVVASGILADGNYFETIQPGMALGRSFTNADDAPDAPLVAVLSHALWRRLGGDSAAIGRAIRVNGMPVVVVGVTRAGFRGMSVGGFFPQTDITLPLSAQPRVYPKLSQDRSPLAADDLLWLRVIARVPEPTSLVATTNAFTEAFRRTTSPVNAGNAAPAVVKLMDGSRGAEPLRGSSVRLLYMLSAVTAFVLLIACTNLSSLMLARGVSRQRDAAVRVALGGGTARVLRGNVLESLLLGFAGAVVGILLTIAARSAIASMLSGMVGLSAGSVNVEVPLDPVVLFVGAMIGIASGVIASILPSLRLTRLDPARWLAQRSSGAGAPRLTQGRMLIALQIAITLPLVLGAMLFLRTLSNLGSVPLGFDPRGVAIFRINPEYTGVQEAQYGQIYQQVLRNLQSVPGVHSVTLMENALMSGVVSNTSVLIGTEKKRLFMNAVGPDFAATMGLRVIAGRLPDISDVDGTLRVGAINEAAARTLFAGTSPIGQTLKVMGHDVTIVGVVSDSRYQSQRDSVPPTLYDAALQRAGWGGHHIVLRADVPIAGLEREIRDAVARVHPDLPVPELTSQVAILEQSKAREIVFARALSLFGALALALACIGLYGVTAYAVARRTNEIGVRIAVGAMPRQVLWLVLRQVVVLAIIGIVAGIPIALASGGFVRNLLYGVAPNDVRVIGVAALSMLAIAGAAGMLPAWRASRLDPMDALRSE